MEPQHDTLDATHLRSCPACNAIRVNRIAKFHAEWIENNEGIEVGRRCETVRPRARRAA